MIIVMLRDFAYTITIFHGDHLSIFKGWSITAVFAAVI